MQNPNLIHELLSEVKNNKKYKTISDEIVLNEIKSYLNKNPNITKPDKIFIKEIRANLHRLYSSYQRGKKNKRIKLLEELKKNPSDIILINKILSTSISTKERLNDYENLYKKIFEISGLPLSIVDLGCNLNPLSYLYMNLKKLDYYAYDIDIEDIKFLNEFFKISKARGLNGKAEILDANNIENISKIPSSDIIFMFKLIDLLNKKNKSIENIILNLIKKTRFIVASFSTRTLSGKPMNLPVRKGFEFMVARIGLNFEKFNSSNEVFYIIKR